MDMSRREIVIESAACDVCGVQLAMSTDADGCLVMPSRWHSITDATGYGYDVCSTCTDIAVEVMLQARQRAGDSFRRDLYGQGVWYAKAGATCFACKTTQEQGSPMVKSDGRWTCLRCAGME